MEERSRSKRDVKNAVSPLVHVGAKKMFRSLVPCDDTDARTTRDCRPTLQHLQISARCSKARSLHFRCDPSQVAIPPNKFFRMTGEGALSHSPTNGASNFSRPSPSYFRTHCFPTCGKIERFVPVCIARMSGCAVSGRRRSVGTVWGSVNLCVAFRGVLYLMRMSCAEDRFDRPESPTGFDVSCMVSVSNQLSAAFVRKSRL